MLVDIQRFYNLLRAIHSLLVFNQSPIPQKVFDVCSFDTCRVAQLHQACTATNTFQSTRWHCNDAAVSALSGSNTAKYF